MLLRGRFAGACVRVSLGGLHEYRSLATKSRKRRGAAKTPLLKDAGITYTTVVLVKPHKSQ